MKYVLPKGNWENWDVDLKRDRQKCWTDFHWVILRQLIQVCLLALYPRLTSAKDVLRKIWYQFMSCLIAVLSPGLHMVPYHIIGTNYIIVEWMDKWILRNEWMDSKMVCYYKVLVLISTLYPASARTYDILRREFRSWVLVSYFEY